jgi:VanZ family protein
MFFKYLWPAFAWALLILIICGVPGHNIPNVSFWKWLKPDKVIHLVVYAILCYFLIRGFTRQEKYPVLKNFAKLIAVTTGIAYGILIEVLQHYVFIGRSGEIFDAMANAIGVLLGLWFFNMKRKKRFNSAF